jgi:curved DNA-binding protein CbpA
MNYYEILEVSTNSDEDTIKSAFRRLARRYHPDVGEGSSCERFREITEAYETLMDPCRRTAYDRSLTAIPIPVRVAQRAEPIRRWGSVPEPMRADEEIAFGFTFEAAALLEQLLQVFEDDWLFSWSFDRRL